MVKAPKDKVGASPLKSLNSTEFSRFCKMKHLIKKETHISTNKNEENTLKELNEIFLMVYGLPK